MIVERDSISTLLLQIVSLKSQLSMEEDTKKNLDERLGTKVSNLLVNFYILYRKLSKPCYKIG